MTMETACLEAPAQLKTTEFFEDYCAGVDEAGRGPLAGPVVAAAVILDPYRPIAGIGDSKKLSEKQREYLYDLICDQALSFAISEVSHQEIDKINILQASLLAMQQSVAALKTHAKKVYVDGNRLPNFPSSVVAEAVVKGDSRLVCVGAASILAKVTRDRIMQAYHALYPHYGFDKHKGYPTKAHYQAIVEFGPCPIHRLTFKGVVSTC
jgi:ribonuclease HII